MKKINTVGIFLLLIVGFALLITGSCKKEEAVTQEKPLPVVTTAALSTITKISAVCGGNVTSDGGSAVTFRGVCWAVTSAPTLLNHRTIESTGAGAFSSLITNLQANTTYYVRAYANNSGGIAYGNEISFTTDSAAIGDDYEGGVIAYILQPGDAGYLAGETHGLIAAANDQSASTPWYNGTNVLVYITDTAIGKGEANTTAIINAQGPGNYAAQLCANLSLNGYNDWYLPSRDELHQLYLHKSAIGSFSTNYFLSSTEYNGSNAWVEQFYDGHQDHSLKSIGFHIRAVRSF